MFIEEAILCFAASQRLECRRIEGKKQADIA